MQSIMATLENTTPLSCFLDGAQFCRNGTSDCWIHIWTIVNLSPDRCYKKRCIGPGAIIPNKPKIVDSCLFTGLHHVATVNARGGLTVWDAWNIEYNSRLYILLGTADRNSLHEWSHRPYGKERIPIVVWFAYATIRSLQRRTAFLGAITAGDHPEVR